MVSLFRVIGARVFYECGICVPGNNCGRDLVNIEKFPDSSKTGRDAFKRPDETECNVNANSEFSARK